MAAWEAVGAGAVPAVVEAVPVAPAVCAVAPEVEGRPEVPVASTECAVPEAVAAAPGAGPGAAAEAVVVVGSAVRAAAPTGEGGAEEGAPEATAAGPVEGEVVAAVPEGVGADRAVDMAEAPTPDAQVEDGVGDGAIGLEAIVANGGEAVTVSAEARHLFACWAPPSLPSFGCLG